MLFLQGLFRLGTPNKVLAFSFLMLFSSTTLFAKGNEEEKILHSDFGSYFTSILSNAQEGFSSLRGFENYKTLLPSSKEWFPVTQLSGTQSCIISDVPQMGLYSYKITWDLGIDYNKALNLDSQVIGAIETALQDLGARYSKEKMHSRGVEENWLITYDGIAGSGNKQTTVLITLTEGTSFKVKMKVIASK